VSNPFPLLTVTYSCPHQRYFQGEGVPVAGQLMDSRGKRQMLRTILLLHIDDRGFPYHQYSVGNDPCECDSVAECCRCS
jgi:hypothetical protein